MFFTHPECPWYLHLLEKGAGRAVLAKAYSVQGFQWCLHPHSISTEPLTPLHVLLQQSSRVVLQGLKLSDCWPTDQFQAGVWEPTHWYLANCSPTLLPCFWGYSTFQTAVCVYLVGNEEHSCGCPLCFWFPFFFFFFLNPMVNGVEEGARKLRGIIQAKNIL